ncbi:MAG TPA: CDP-diacylglycerol--glycerol-3-phosphate 3-phosphatidyltransferase [Candidatus Sulfotelmatobacter sp.]|nr:CDP-diacylglycerol--glycerol-3-phosphate 3-phosphatidyltransferase [Candidatus Sulfotelmatobacter sp.]
MNLSNGLTISRLAAIPLLMFVLIARFPGHDQVAAAVFLVFSFTDTLDGQLARRRGTVSDLGKFLDPLADKLFVLAVLIVLVQEGLVAAWVVVLIFSRELIITILRSVAAGQGRAISAAPLGKTKTVMQMAAVTLLILQRPYGWLVPVADVAVGIAVVFTIWSGLDYVWRFRYLLGPFDSSQLTRRAGPSGGAPATGETIDALVGDLGKALEAAGLSVSVAESCTGGMVGSMITDRPGSSEYFLGGVIAYSDGVKRDQLGVAATLLKRAGAVSAEVAEAMAQGARARFGSDLAVSTTGIAGPGGATAGKPVGLTYIAVASARGTVSRELRFAGDRSSNRRDATLQALQLLLEQARLGQREKTA